MKGLILKDFYAMRQQLRIYFIILAFWLFLAFQDNNASFFGGVTAFFSVMIPEEKMIDKIKTISVAPLFAEAIRRIYCDGSVSELF